MCGICLIVGFLVEEVFSKESDSNLMLMSRGPDVIDSKVVQLDDEKFALFKGCVLWLQGSSPQRQPISDEEGNVFLWNGDDFNFQRDLSVSDSLNIFNVIREKSGEEIPEHFAAIEGPWSFIYYSASAQKLYFGRDQFGRRSLLWSLPRVCEDYFILSSVARREENLQEVPALGIYCCSVNSILSKDKDIILHPFAHVNSEQLLVDELKAVKISNIRLSHKITASFCCDIPSDKIIETLKSCPVSLESENILFFSNLLTDETNLFKNVFENAIRKRIKASPVKCKGCTKSEHECSHSKFAVLFSGGLDSALIALFLALILPSQEQIDLINVSFESRPTSGKSSGKNGKEDRTPTKFHSPDRDSGLTCLKQLQSIDESRTWNFVEVNVTTEELQKERSCLISHLIAPHSSVLDDSIGCALYFGGRGSGALDGKPYTTPARILFSGLGADEQLAGYSRHRGVFNENGWKGLLEEVQLEMSRIHNRNCGRDDRVLSHHGRVIRFPYLDEDVVSCLNSLPIWKKANLYLPRGLGEKWLLRVIAAQNSLLFSALLPKRAIQFGSRIAKLEKNKEQGYDVCTRLQCSS